MWFRNIASDPVRIADLSVTTGPGGEVEWPDYDHAAHGVLTGHVPISGPGGDPVPYPEPGEEAPPGDPPKRPGKKGAPDTATTGEGTTP